MVNVHFGKDVTCVNDTGGQFAAGVNYTVGRVAASGVDTVGAPLIANILSKFLNNNEMVLIGQGCE